MSFKSMIFFSIVGMVMYSIMCDVSEYFIAVCYGYICGIIASKLLMYYGR